MNHKLSKSFCILSIALLIIFSANIFGQNAQTQKCADDVDYDAIIAQATKDIKFSKYNLPAFLKRGRAYIRTNEFEKAFEDFQSVTDLNPKESKAFYFRGYMYAKRANYEKSIQEFSIAIDLNPEYADAFYGRGRSYDFKNELNLAFDDFSKVISLDSNYLEAYYTRGAVNQKLLNQKEALKDWSKANDIITEEINLSPKNVCSFDNYTRRGMLYVVSGDLKKGLADYNKSIELKSNDFEAYYYRAELHLRQNNARAAINDLNTAIKLDGDFAENYFQRAIAYEKLGETEKAKADRQTYEELSKKP